MAFRASELNTFLLSVANVETRGRRPTSSVAIWSQNMKRLDMENITAPKERRKMEKIRAGMLADPKRYHDPRDSG